MIRTRPVRTPRVRLPRDPLLARRLRMVREALVLVETGDHEAALPLFELALERMELLHHGVVDEPCLGQVDDDLGGTVGVFDALLEADPTAEHGRVLHRDNNFSALLL